MHASIKQNSLFKVVENKKESDDEEPKNQKIEPPPPEPVQDPPKVQPAEVPKEEVKEEPPPEPIKPEPEEKEAPQVEIPKIPEFIEKPAENLIIPEKTIEIITPPQEKPVKKYSKAVMKILADEIPKKSEKIDVEKRFYDYQAKINKKIQTLQEEKDKELLEICTFCPVIKKKSAKRGFEQFLRHVSNFQKVKNERLEKMKKEKEDEVPSKSSFKPTLSEKTIELTKALKPEAGIHERLFKESVVLKTKHEQLVKDILAENCTFKPKIESGSNGKREGDTRIRLFELSKEKKNVDEGLNKKGKDRAKLIDSTSENMIREKYTKKIEEVLPLSLARDSMKSPDDSQKNPEEVKSEEIKLSYAEFINLLIKLKFLHPQTEPNSYSSEYSLACKAWSKIGGEPCSTVDLEKIKSFILDILILNHSLKSHKIHVEFLKFYLNQKESSTPADSSPLPSFRPEIDAKSQKLAAVVNENRAANMGNKKIEHVLFNLHKEKLKKLQQRRETLEMIVSPECTFTPQTTRGPKLSEEEFKDSVSLSSDYLRLLNEKKISRNELLYSFNKVELERKEKMQRTSEDWEIERNMGECSFVPDLDKPKFDFKVRDEAKGIEQAIDRVRKAREEKKAEVFYPPMKFGVDFKPKVENN
jgi:hypothetical protein